MRPDISVILAVHDRWDSLIRAAAAALAQTERPREVIVVCDASGGVPADVRATLRGLARDAGADLVCRHLARPCLPASRNAGIGLARGEVLLLLDDDHELPRDYLARLGALYRADTARQVDAIGGRVAPPPGSVPPAGQWLWDALMYLAAHLRWRPRRQRSRYLRLPAALAGQLRPASYLTGGTVSLRRQAAGVVRFDERLTGYALGEDRDFSYRATQRLGVFVAPGLVMTHHRPAGARTGGVRYGHMLSANFLHLAARALEPGVGKWFLVGWNLAGLAAAHAVFALIGRRAWHAGVLKGMLAGLWRAVRSGAGGRPCAC